MQNNRTQYNTRQYMANQKHDNAIQYKTIQDNARQYKTTQYNII